MTASQNFEEIKEKIKEYDKEVDYEKKMKLGKRLMEDKFDNVQKNLDKIRLEQARFLFKIPDQEFKIKNDEDTKCDMTKMTLNDQQTFLKRFLSPDTGNTGLLLFHATGMGKTCSSLNIAENFLNVMSGKTLIICSDIIQQRFKDEIKGKRGARGCLGDVILKKLTPGWRLLSEEEIDKSLDKFIKDHFEFVTLKKLFLSFQNELNFIEKYERLETAGKEEKEVEVIEKEKTELFSMLRKYINDKFSNRVIIYDEVHSIRSNDFIISEKQSQIKFLNLIMKFATNVRLILMSATPMYHNSAEIFTIMKLLMLNDKSVPLEKIEKLKNMKSTELSKETKALLQYFSTNFVSYATIDKNNENFPVVLSPFQSENSSLKSHKLTQNDTPSDFLTADKAVIDDKYAKFIFKSYLSKTQLDALDNFKDVTISDEEILEDENAKGDTTRNQVSLARMMNVCYAADKNTYKSNQFMDFFEENKTNKGHIFKYINEDRKFEGESLQEMSPKIHKIIEVIAKSIEQQQPGIIMVYSRFIGSGAYPICVALEEAGFNRYGKDINFIRAKKAESNEYILLSNRRAEDPSDLFKTSNEELISKINSETEHRVKVIVCTDIVKEGVDFKNIRQIHILEPWYNESKLTQIIGRGARMCSHITSIEQQRNVTIFKHCCISKAKKNGKLMESFDYYTYKKSQQNLNKIKEIEKILQSNSIDCHFNNERQKLGQKRQTDTHINMLGETVSIEVDDTSENSTCAYDELKLKSSDIHIVEHDVETTILKIQKFFESNKYFHHNIDDLKEKLDYNEFSDIFDLALSKILKDKRRFRIGDKEGRLEKSKNHLIFVDTKVDYPIISKMQLNLYERQLKDKRQKITEIKLSPPSISVTPVQNVLDLIEEKFKELNEIIEHFVKNVNKSIVYSMVLHRLNSEESEAFIEKVLNDQKGKWIDDVVNDMVIKFNNKTFAVDIPKLSFKFKDDSEIKEAGLYEVQLEEKLKLKSKKFPKYYRKFQSKDNSTALFIIRREKAKHANASNNTSLDEMIKSAKELGTKNDEIFKDTFDLTQIGQKDKNIKNRILDVLEYSARYYEYYVHPMIIKKN